MRIRGSEQILSGTVTSSETDGSVLAVAKFVVRETPSGLVNGSNVTFTLARTPVAGSEQVFLNGALQEPGGGADYTISGATITYNAAPAGGARLRVTYVSA